MPAATLNPDPAAQQRVFSRLNAPIRTRDDLLRLFVTDLGFERLEQPIPPREDTFGRGQALELARQCRPLRLAGHGDFQILYAELDGERLDYGRQRVLATKLLETWPDALFVFALKDTLGQPAGAEIHLVNVKGDSAARRAMPAPPRGRQVFRRFRLGPGEHYRTAAERLALLDLTATPDLTTLELRDRLDAAFDKEPVTRKFFADFCAVFEKTCHDIANRHPRWPRETVERETQTLLNRLLFLWFIQRKGWLNRQRDFLVAHFRQHFARDPRGTSYLRDFLRPVSVKLSTKGPQADLPGLDLPFLNGGLFADEYGAEQRDDDVRRRHELRVGNDTFQHIFDDLLEAYNFTVREDTPLDVDVAIDPEMLGKIFESLVLQLEQSRVGGKSSRHDTGSYYTPRPIVHYLCREALAAWLEDAFVVPPSGGSASAPSSAQPAEAGTTNARSALPLENRRSQIEDLLALDASDALDETERATLDALLTPEEARTLASRLYDLRACDLAVGSGAFPVALLHELVNLARLAETRARGKDPVAADPRWLFDTKTRFIERCLYGVDLQDRAIEICKLRLWLSLVVDYPLDVDVDACEPHSFRDALRRLPALPNLDFKIRRANSLVDMIRGEPVPLGEFGAGDAARPILNRLIAAKRDFYNAESVPEKRRLRLAIYEATAELAQVELTWARNRLGLIPDPANAQKVAELDHVQREMAAVLAEIRAARKLKAADQDAALERLRARFDDPKQPTFVWQLDFAEVFHRDSVAAGFQPAGEGGILPPGKASANSEPRENLPARSAGLEAPLYGRPGGPPLQAGFDLLVGNPPYVRIQVLNQTAPEQVAWFKTHYAAASKGNYDLYVVFVERGLQLLAPRGQLAYILPHKFFNAQYGQPLRELLARGRHLRHVVHFGDQQIFPGATNYVCLLFLAKAGADTCRWVRADDLPAWLATQQAPETALPAARLTAAEWNFAVGPASALFDKLQAMPVKLGDVADIFVGLQTSADDVFILNFVSETAKTLTLESKALDQHWTFEKDLLHPLLSGTDIRPFAPLPHRQFILFPYSVTDEQADLIPLATLASRFPRTAEYLRKNKKRLEGREGGKFRGENWHRFGRSQNLGIQNRSKVCVPRLVEQLGATWDSKGTHFLDNVDVGGVTFRPEHSSMSLAYLLALLNSALLRWFFPHVSAPFRGGWRSANRQFLSQLPIRPIDFGAPSERAEHDALVGLVERILSAKRASPAADTTVLECEIDERVYRLYGLTPDEIKLVEDASK